MAMTLLLRCMNLEETKVFYRQILNFQVAATAEQPCTVRKGGGSILFTEEDLWGGESHCTGTIYFFLPDVDRYYEVVKDKAIVRWPLQDMDYGIREFGVKDCNGYTLAFAKRIR